MAQVKRKSPQELGLVPVDPDEDEESRRPPPTTRSPRAARTLDPKALGLVPADDEPPPPANDDVSPEALGLVPADEPAAPPPPPEEEDFGDWAWHKAEQFIDTVRGAVGLDPAPEPANADMSVTEERPPPKPPGEVKPGKLFEEGGVLDAIIPDPVENVIRSVGDFVTDDRTQRNLAAGAYSSGAGLMKLSKNAVGLINYVNDFLVEETGLGVTADESEIPFAGQTWGQLQQKLAEAERAYMEAYGRERLPDEERGVVDALVEALPQIPAMVAEYGAAAAYMGPIAGFAAVDALMHADEGPEAAFWAGLKGAALGAFFEWANILSRPLRIPALAAAGGGTTALSGGTDADIAAQAILFPVLGLPQRSGPVGVRYLREHGIKADLRDAGAHIRDMLVGGNVGRAQNDMNTAAASYKAVQDKHKAEIQEETARAAVEISAARANQPGELTPSQAAIDARVSRVQGESQSRMEEIRTRQMRAEMEARHAYEMAARRYQRALHPFRTPMFAMPYARALQSAERQVLVEYETGYEGLRRAGKAADDRLQAALDYAKELRERAADTPEQAQRNRDEADHIEMEGRRLSYEMRRAVEEEIEARITRAEAKAERARADMAETLARGNAVEGRRARVLVAERDVQEAARSGIRRINRGSERARRLIEMGDEHVRQVERRLNAVGIKKDDPQTAAEYDAAWTKANETREIYRDMASRELLEAQYAADSRVQRAILRRDMAVQAAEQAGVDVSRLSRRTANERETKPDDARRRTPEDDWDLPDEPGDIRRGVEYEHAYRKALEGARDDPMLGQIARNVDPILERIQDPADVLPAINRIAKELEHESPSRRGRQTESDREILAEQLGMTEKEFLETPYGRAFSDFEITAALTLLRRQWRRVQEAYAAYKRDPGSKVLGDRVRLELMRFIMIVERLRGVAAEAGRALRMFREVKKEFGGINDVLSDRALERIMFYDNPGTAFKIAKKFFNGDWMGAVIEFYINGLLSSFQTTFVNIFSGFNMLFWKPMQTAVAATWGLTRWGVYNMIARPLIAPIRAMYRGLAKSGVLGARAAETARGKGGMIGDAYYANKTMQPHADRVRLGEVGARMRGIFEAMTELSSNNAFFVFFRSLFTGEKYLNETNFGGYNAKIPWWLGGPIIRLPGRILQAVDDFFKVMMYRSAIRAHAYRQAVAESRNLSFAPKDAMNSYRTIRARYRELTRHPTGYILAQARQEALEGTFQQTPAAGTRFVGTLRQDAPWTAFLIPFHRVLLNSVEFLVSGTPLAPIYRRARNNLMGANGRAAKDMQIAHMIMVTGGAFAVYVWALNGNVRPGYNADQKARTVQGISGTPPLAIRVPGTENEWVTLNRIDPMGGVLALGAAAAEASRAGYARGDEQAGQRAWSLLWSSVFNMTLERAGMTGLVDFMEAMRGGSYGNDINSWDRWFEKLIATLTIPQGVAVYARTKDPYLRYAHSTIESMMNRIPGQREKLWPVRNLWGSPIKAFDSYGEGAGDLLDLTMPMYWGERSKDPATKLIQEIYDTYNWAPGQLSRNVKGRRLTDEEYDYYAQRTGQIAYEKVRAIADSEEYAEVKRLEEEVRTINKTLRRNRKVDPDSNAPITDWFGSKLRPFTPAEKEMLKRREALREELRKKRLKIFNQTKQAVTDARAAARLELVGREDGSVKGRFPDFWKRPRSKDPGRVPGELPTWAEDQPDGWFEAEEDEEWQADEEARARYGDEAFDPADPYGDQARWRKMDEERRRQGNPPGP